jgi:hypothetical protein
LKRLVADAGVSITGYHSVDGEEDLEAWLDGSETGQEERREIREAMDLELKGSMPTCFQPFTRDGKIMFVHIVGVVVGEKR